MKENVARHLIERLRRDPFPLSGSIADLVAGAAALGLGTVAWTRFVECVEEILGRPPRDDRNALISLFDLEERASISEGRTSRAFQRESMALLEVLRTGIEREAARRGMTREELRSTALETPGAPRRLKVIVDGIERAAIDVATGFSAWQIQMKAVTAVEGHLGGRLPSRIKIGEDVVEIGTEEWPGTAGGR